MKNFSIVVPAHNEEKFLPSFLKSVCSQNLLPEEMVLIDDNSNDRTKKIMIDFQKKNDFIKVFSANFKKNNAFSFCRTDNSFHGVEKVEEKAIERKLLQVSIYGEPR